MACGASRVIGVSSGVLHAAADTRTVQGRGDKLPVLTCLSAGGVGEWS